MKADLELFVLIEILRLKNAYFEFDDDKLVVKVCLHRFLFIIGASQ